MDRLDPTATGCEVNADSGIPFLRFSADAQIFFAEWYTETPVPHTVAGAITGPMVSHLAKYGSLMPSLALQFHLTATDPSTCPFPAVSLESAEMAAAGVSCSKPMPSASTVPPPTATRPTQSGWPRRSRRPCPIPSGTGTWRRRDGAGSRPPRTSARAVEYSRGSGLGQGRRGPHPRNSAAAADGGDLGAPQNRQRR